MVGLKTSFFSVRQIEARTAKVSSDKSHGSLLLDKIT